MKAIYGIINKINGNKYVGSAINFYKRKTLHLKQLRKQLHHSKYLQNAWDKYGEENFEFIILEKVDDKSLLITREQWWIDNSNSVYNVCKIAGSSLGVKRSDETRKKIGDAKRGFKHTLESRKKITENQTGEKHWGYGKKLSEETKAKKSESMKEYYKTHDHPNKNKKMSDEQKKILSKRWSKPIIQFDLENNKIREWESIKVAAKNLGITESTIVLYLKGKTKKPQKYKWEYKTQD